MSKFITKIAAAATLALAAIPMLALSTAAGVAAFEQRLDRVAKTLCDAQRLGVGTRLVKTEGCIEAVRAEAMDSLTQAQRSQVAAYSRTELAAR